MEIIKANLKYIIYAVIGIVLLVLVIKNLAKIKKFLLEVKQELGKVAWSTRQELLGSTVVVITVTAIMAAYIGIIDLGLSKFLRVLFR